MPLEQDSHLNSSKLLNVRFLQTNFHLNNMVASQNWYDSYNYKRLSSESFRSYKIKCCICSYYPLKEEAYINVLMIVIACVQ